MNKIAKRSLIPLAIIALIISCKKADSQEESPAKEVFTSTDTISSSAAVQKEGETRKFVRTADLKFKIKNGI